VYDIEIKSRLVCPKRPHSIRMDDFRIFKKLTGGYSGGRRPVVRPTGRWEGALRRDKSVVYGYRTGRRQEVRENMQEGYREDRGPKMGQIAIEKKVVLKHVVTHELNTARARDVMGLL
jgi:hypothetical protein